MLHRALVTAARGLRGIGAAERALIAPAMIETPAFRCLATDAAAMIIDGKDLARTWEKSLAKEAAELTKELGRKPGLAVILAGKRPDSGLYVQRKQEACERVGVNYSLYKMPENVVEEDVRTIVEQLSNDISIDGILVQLPLPEGLKEELILEHISPVKDVDGLSPVNVGRMLMRGVLPTFSPCPALAVIELLKRSNLPIHNKKCVVLGDSNTVGLPLAVLFRDAGAAAVTICHRVAYEEHEESVRQAQAEQRATAEACMPPIGGRNRESDRDASASEEVKPANQFLPHVCQTADILVVAVGHAELVTSDWVKPGAVVIDVGINVRGPSPEGQKQGKKPQSKLIGDVKFSEVSQVASAITPVPRGVGPMTICALIDNTLLAARRHAGIWRPDPAIVEVSGSKSH